MSWLSWNSCSLVCTWVAQSKTDMLNCSVFQDTIGCFFSGRGRFPIQCFTPGKRILWFPPRTEFRLTACGKLGTGWIQMVRFILGALWICSVVMENSMHVYVSSFAILVWALKWNRQTSRWKIPVNNRLRTWHCILTWTFTDVRIRWIQMQNTLICQKFFAS